MSAKLNIIIDEVMFKKAGYKSENIHGKLKPLFFVDGYEGEGGYLKVLGKKLEGYFTKCGSVNGMAVLVGECYKKL